VLPWVSAAAASLFALGLYLAFFVSPADYQQGDSVRIMYVHVPAATLAMAAYVLTAIAALGTLVWRHPLADVAARAAAPIGAAFTFLGLVTGSIWGARCGAHGGCGTRGSPRSSSSSSCISG
jgi:heme exporter protein C